MIKKFAKSRKSIMVSIQKNNDRLIRSQLQWRGDSSHVWSTKSRLTSLLMKKAIPEAEGKVEPRGALRKVNLSKKIFEYIQDEWAIKNKAFDKFRDRYRMYVKQCRRGRRVPVSMAAWEDPRITEDERRSLSLSLSLFL